MSNKILFPIILVLALAGIGGYMYLTKSASPAPVIETQPLTSDSVSPTTAVSGESKTYTLADVAAHGTREDCWLAVEGNVYDVTPFIAGGKHPGKEAILQGCGKDATELFNTRPMGSKTPHSDKARNTIANFIIGTLAE